jgi:PQQ-like domain
LFPELIYFCSFNHCGLRVFASGLDVLTQTFRAENHQMKLTVFLIAAFFTTILPTQTRSEVTVDWSRKLDGATASTAADYHAVSVAPSGNVFALGSTEGWSEELALASIDHSGRTLWQVFIADAISAGLQVSGAQSADALSDAGGNAVVAFTCRSPAWSGNCVAKFDSQNGTLLWLRKFDETISPCALAKAGAYGFYRSCSGSTLQRLSWDGDVAWISGEFALPPFKPTTLASGDIVRVTPTAPTANIFKALSALTGLVKWQIVVPGEVKSYLPLSDGGMAIQTQRSIGSQNYVDSVYRISATGNVLWVSDYRVPGYSYSGEPMFISGGVIIRHPAVTAGFRRIAIDMNGVQIWDQPTESTEYPVHVSGTVFISSPSVVAGRRFAALDLQNGAVSGSSVDIAGSIRLFQTQEYLFVARRADNVSARKTIFERYGSSMAKDWQSDSFSLTIGRALQQSPVGMEDCPRLRQIANGQWITLSKRYTRYGGDGEIVAQVFDSAGVPSPAIGLGFDGAVCPASFDDSTELFALGLDGSLRQYLQGGVAGWSASPPGLVEASLSKTMSVALQDQTFITTAIQKDSQDMMWRYNRNGQLLSGPAPILLSGATQALIPGSGASFYALHNRSQISLIDQTNAVQWSVFPLGNSCVKDIKVNVARNNQLLVSARDCNELAHLIRISADGEILWTSTMPQNNSLTFSVRAFSELATESIVLVGCVTPTFSVFDAPGVPKAGATSMVQVFSASGNVIWSKEINAFSSTTECANALAVNSDGKMYISVDSDSSCGKSLLLTLSADGQIEHANSSAVSNPNVAATSMKVAPNSMLFVIGDGFVESSRRFTASVRGLKLRGESCDLDVGDDGQVLPLSDGVPILKGMFGFNPTLNNNVPESLNACELGSELFEARVKAINGVQPHHTQMSIPGDIDGDGQVSPMTDGLLLLRGLLGLQGPELIAGVNFLPTATRKASDDITAYLRRCGVANVQ